MIQNVAHAVAELRAVFERLINAQPMVAAAAGARSDRAEGAAVAFPPQPRVDRPWLRDR